MAHASIPSAATLLRDPSGFWLWVSRELAVSNQRSTQKNLHDTTVTAPFETVVQAFLDWVELYVATPPSLMFFNDTNLYSMTDIRDDIVNGHRALNDALVGEVSYDSMQTRAILIFLFALAGTVLLGSYIFVFWKIAEDLMNDMETISWLFFSLPPPLVETVPHLKVWIWSMAFFNRRMLTEGNHSGL